MFFCVFPFSIAQPYRAHQKEIIRSIYFFVFKWGQGFVRKISAHHLNVASLSKTDDICNGNLITPMPLMVSSFAIRIFPLTLPGAEETDCYPKNTNKLLQIIFGWSRYLEICKWPRNLWNIRLRVKLNIFHALEDL